MEQRRIAALDGLRALACTWVFLFHAQLSGLGWAGVDFFFVLSGFVVTRVLLRDLGTPDWKKQFYLRRAFRLLPAYLAYIAFAIPAVIPCLDNWNETLWFVLPTGNLFLASINHWLSGPLDLTWSLAVEFQFYLIWPLLVEWAGVKRLSKLCFGLIAAALVFRCTAVISSPGTMSAYVLLPGKIDALALGGLLASWDTQGVLKSMQGRLNAAAAVSLAVMIAIVTAFGPGLLMPAMSAVG